jgi:ribosome maturation factor RimP
MDLSERVRHLIEPAVGDMGFDVVRVLVSGSRKPSLQTMIERRDGRAVSVDDCTRVSRAISTLLDVEEPIKGAYTLEVSSPGIDRPLVKLGDFERFRGFQAKVEIARPLDGRRRFKGRLLGVENDTVRIEIEEGEVKLPYPDIQRAKLVLTDDLIAASEEKKRA